MTCCWPTCALAATLLGGLAPMAHAQKAVDYRVFALRPSATGRNAVCYGASQRAVRAALGQPTATSRFYYEIEQVWATVLHYGPNQLFFVSNRLDAAELHDGRWVVGQPGGFTFRVGSRLSHRPGQAPLFGSFSVQEKAGRSRNFTYSAISFGNLKDKVVGDDEGYEIQFDQQGRVSRLFFGTN